MAPRLQQKIAEATKDIATKTSAPSESITCSKSKAQTGVSEIDAKAPQNEASSSKERATNIERMKKS